MKDNFTAALDFSMSKEGIYSDHKADGETFLGINRRFYPGWLGWIEVDKAKKAGANVSALALTTEMRDCVARFYKHNYWDALKCAEFDLLVALCVFDGAINSGSVDSVQWIQKACNDLGSQLKVDGVLGSKTAAAIKSKNEVELTKFALGYRLEKYYRLRTNYPQFLGGWISRIVALLLYKK